MILKRLDSFNVAAARLIRRHPENNDALADFYVRFHESDESAPHPGLHLERYREAQSPDVWSARAGLDLRVILRKRASAWYAAHVGHHEAAYRWAREHEIMLPKTRPANDEDVAALERVLGSRETQGHDRTDQGSSGGAESRAGNGNPFEAFDDRALQDFGVPYAMIPMLRRVKSVDDFIDHVHGALPDELADRLWAAIVGDFRTAYDGLQRAAEQAESGAQEGLLPAHVPEVTQESLRLLAQHPESSWVALPDAQQQMIAKGHFDGPVLVVGGAGTGKTVVGVQRALYLASQKHEVLLTTFTNALVTFLEGQLAKICPPELMQHIHVNTVDRIAANVVWEADQAGAHLTSSSEFDANALRAAEIVESGRILLPYDSVVVDEAQDLSPQRLAFVAAICGAHPDNLMLLADGRQRIYGEQFDLEDLGFDFEGRRFELGTAYRNTQEILEVAALVLDDASQGTQPTAYATGEAPRFVAFRERRDEIAWVGAEIAKLLPAHDGMPGSVAVLVPTRARMERCRGPLYHEYGISTYDDESPVRLLTMHGAKGIEFQTVFIVDACDEELPHHKGLEESADRGQVDDFLLRQRNLLYTAMTRATDRLYVTWSGRPSRFLVRVLEALGGPEEAK